MAEPPVRMPACTRQPPVEWNGAIATAAWTTDSLLECKRGVGLHHFLNGPRWPLNDRVLRHLFLVAGRYLGMNTPQAHLMKISYASM